MGAMPRERTTLAAADSITPFRTQMTMTSPYSATGLPRSIDQSVLDKTPT